MPQTDVGSSEDLLAELCEMGGTRDADHGSWRGQSPDGHRGGRVGAGGRRADPHPRPRWFRRQSDRAHAGRGQAGAGGGASRHGVVAWHAGRHAVSGERREGARAGHLRHEGGQFPRVPCGALDPASEGSDKAADRAAADTGRGGRQPDFARMDRARGGGGGLRADPGAGGPGRRLRHRAQGRRTVRHAGGRPRRAFRRRVPGRRVGGGGTGAADRADTRHGGSRSRHHAERGTGVGRFAAERDFARCGMRDRSAGELGRRTASIWSACCWRAPR